MVRNSHQRCSIKKAVFLKKFRTIHTKTPVLESLFNKVAGLKAWRLEGLKACNFIKKRLKGRCFPVNIAKFLRAPILKNISERLLLYDKNIFLISLVLINYKIINRHNQCKSKFKRASRFSPERVSSLILVSFCEFYKLKAKNKSTCTSLKKRSFV